jgi:hypothetical protein
MSAQPVRNKRSGDYRRFFSWQASTRQVRLRVRPSTEGYQLLLPRSDARGDRGGHRSRKRRSLTSIRWLIAGTRAGRSRV